MVLLKNSSTLENFYQQNTIKLYFLLRLCCVSVINFLRNPTERKIFLENSKRKNLVLLLQQLFVDGTTLLQITEYFSAYGNHIKHN